MSWAGDPLRTNSYRIGKDGKYDLMPAFPWLAVGVAVVRGPDWRWGNQDNGAGNRGVVAEIKPTGWVAVQWDGSEGLNTYRYAASFCGLSSPLARLSPHHLASHPTTSPLTPPHLSPCAGWGRSAHRTCLRAQARLPVPGSRRELTCNAAPTGNG